MKKALPAKQKIVWPDDSEYFLTTSTFLHYPYFKQDNQKYIVLNKIKEIQKYLNVPISAYSIAVNHFHLKFYLPRGNLMTRIKTILHSGISREYRKSYDVPYQEFWQSSRAYYIKNEKMSWKIMGYIIGNLLKHKEVSTFEELEQSPFSSFKYFAEEFGRQEARNLVYTVIGVDEDAEGLIDLEDLRSIKIQKPPPWAA